MTRNRPWSIWWKYIMSNMLKWAEQELKLAGYDVNDKACCKE